MKAVARGGRQVWLVTFRKIRVSSSTCTPRATSIEVAARAAPPVSSRMRSGKRRSRFMIGLLSILSAPHYSARPPRRQGFLIPSDGATPCLLPCLFHGPSPGLASCPGSGGRRDPPSHRRSCPGLSALPYLAGRHHYLLHRPSCS